MGNTAPPAAASELSPPHRGSKTTRGHRPPAVESTRKAFYRRVASPFGSGEGASGSVEKSREDDVSSTTSTHRTRLPSIVEWFEPTDFTVGPHSKDAQHGGPPAALLLHCIERLAASTNLHVVSHTTLQLFRPVPVKELMMVSTCVLRKGSRVGHFRSSLYAYPRTATTSAQADEASEESHLVAQLSAVMQRREPISALPPPPQLTDEWLSPPEFGGDDLDFSFWRTAGVTYFDALKARVSKGGPGKGYTTFWFLVDAATVEGEAQSTAQKFLVMADSGGGGSFYVDTRRYQFSNPDFCVSFLQLPPLGDDDWIGMTAQSGLDRSSGAGLVFTKLFTKKLTVGIATQSLTIRSRQKMLQTARL